MQTAQRLDQSSSGTIVLGGYDLKNIFLKEESHVYQGCIYLIKKIQWKKTYFNRQSKPYL